MHGDKKKISSLLVQYDQYAPPDKWVLRPMTHGKQARTFLAVNVGAVSAFSNSGIVVKVYNTRTNDVMKTLLEEHESLTRMHRCFRNVSVDGWKISAPRPLFISNYPPALIMTHVPGVPLDILFKNINNNTDVVLTSIMYPIASSLYKYWSTHHRIIGDVNYGNILCDLASKTISFVDPGAPSSVFYDIADAFMFRPASPDLGYLLFEVCATNVKCELLSLHIARRRSIFIKDIILIYVNKFVPETESENFLVEIFQSATFHLKMIRPGYLPRGLWRRYVAKKTSLNINNAFDSIRDYYSMATHVI